MEVKLSFKDVKTKTAWMKYYTENNVTLANFKYAVERSECQGIAFLAVCRKHLPAYERAKGETHPDQGVADVLRTQMSINAVAAMSEKVDNDKGLDTSTMVPTLLTMNHLNIAKIAFVGGEVPRYYIDVSKKESSEGAQAEAEVKVSKYAYTPENIARSYEEKDHAKADVKKVAVTPEVLPVQPVDAEKAPVGEEKTVDEEKKVEEMTKQELIEDLFADKKPKEENEEEEIDVDTSEEEETDEENLPVSQKFYVQEVGDKVPHVMVVAGLCCVPNAAYQVLKQQGIKNIKKITPLAAQLATYFVTSTDKTKSSSYTPHQFGSHTQLFLPGFSKNMVNTEALYVLLGMVTSNSGSKDQLANELASHFSLYMKQIKPMVPQAPMKSIGYVATLAGQKLTSHTLKSLELTDAIINAGGSKIFKYLKNADTGFFSINAPWKWAPVFVFLMRNSPFVMVKGDGGGKITNNPHYSDLGHNVSFYGAKGGRMKAMVDTFFTNVKSYDIERMPDMSKDVTREMLEEWSVPTWEVGDIINYMPGKDTLLISDVFMKGWKSDQGKRDAANFIAHLLRGQMAIGDTQPRELGSVKLMVAAKCMLPKYEHLSLFEGSYPFVIASTARAINNEVIFIKWPGMNGSNYLQRLEDLKNIYQDEKLPLRFDYVTKKSNFELAIRTRLMQIIQERLFYVLRLQCDWTKLPPTLRPRTWWLAGPQLPKLYKKPAFGMKFSEASWEFDLPVARILGLDGQEFTYEDMEVATKAFASNTVPIAMEALKQEEKELEFEEVPDDDDVPKYDATKPAVAFDMAKVTNAVQSFVALGVVGDGGNTVKKKKKSKKN